MRRAGRAVLAVARKWAENSGRERTAALVYSVGWTQHSMGAQYIRAGAIIQLLLGNIGRPGGGVFALRGHASIQGSTDVPTLFNLLPGYLAMPHGGQATLADYLDDIKSRNQKGFWHNADAYMISLLKEYWGEKATAANDYCFDYLPRINGDHGTYRTVMDMVDGKVFGYFLLGQNPAVGSAHGRLQRLGMANLDWLVVRDLVEIESATFWKDGPEVETGEITAETCRTEVFLFPAASHVEKAGTFTQTQRKLAAGARHHRTAGLRRVGRLGALGALMASMYFLIADLGRPLRFHHMLRVAKPSSPMSVGTWILGAYGPGAGLAAVAELMPKWLRRMWMGRLVGWLARRRGCRLRRSRRAWRLTPQCCWGRRPFPRGMRRTRICRSCSPGRRRRAAGDWECCWHRWTSQVRRGGWRSWAPGWRWWCRESWSSGSVSSGRRSRRARPHRLRKMAEVLNICGAVGAVASGRSRRAVALSGWHSSRAAPAAVRHVRSRRGIDPRPTICRCAATGTARCALRAVCRRRRVGSRRWCQVTAVGGGFAESRCGGGIHSVMPWRFCARSSLLRRAMFVVGLRRPRCRSSMSRRGGSWPTRDVVDLG